MGGGFYEKMELVKFQGWNVESSGIIGVGCYNTIGQLDLHVSILSAKDAKGK